MKLVESPIARDLKASLIARGAAKPVGSTWGSFKSAVEALGVRDDDTLACIEYGVRYAGSSYIVRDEDEDGIEVREI